MKRLLLISFMIFMGVQTVSAKSWLEEQWDNMTSGMTNEIKKKNMSIGSQGSGAYIGGSYTYSSPSVTARPFNVRAPSFSAGCSGISLDMGAFQYNKDELIKVGKAIISQAPGYAFQLALQILCPSCADLMNTLNELANMINSMQLDSCQILTAAGNALSDKLGGSAAKENFINSGAENFNMTLKDIKANGAATVQGFLADKFQCAAYPAGGCPTEFYDGNKTLLEIVMAKVKHDSGAAATSLFRVWGGEGDATDIIRAIVGDVKILVTGDQRIVLPFTQIVLNPKYTNLIYNMIGYNDASDIGKLSNTKDTVQIKKLSAGLVELDVSVTTFQSFTNTQMNGIIDKYRGRMTPLDDIQLNFLGTFRSPVYKVLNRYSVDQTVLTNFANTFKILGGTQLAYEFISVITQSFHSAVGDIEKTIRAAKAEDADLIDKMKKMDALLQDFQQAAYQAYLAGFAEFDKKIKDGNTVATLDNMNRAMMARHPVMGGSSFVMGLGK